MNPHLTTDDTDYKAKRFDAIVALEEGGNSHLTPYKDSSNRVTIGIDSISPTLPFERKYSRSSGLRTPL